jgi:hypothetical protein
MLAARLIWMFPLALSMAQSSAASVIVDVGSIGSNGPAVQSGQYVQQQWTQTQAYQNVDIAIFLYSWSPDIPFHVSAFLTADTGPSAIPPPLATTSFTGVTANDVGQEFTLFSGLTLGPGTYYLTLSSTDVGAQVGAIWLEGPATPLFVDTGITLAAPGFLDNTAGVTYPPASVFTPDTSAPAFAFLAPLDFTMVSSAPEPSTVTMFAAAAGLLFFWRRLRV